MSRRNNNEAKTTPDAIRSEKCTCGCEDTKKIFPMSGDMEKHLTDTILGKTITENNNTPTYPFMNNVNYTSPFTYAGQFTPFIDGSNIQALYKTADGADTRIAEAVKKFITDYDEFILGMLKRNADVNDEIVNMLVKSADMAKSCLMNSIMRFVTQPCTDDEVMYLITDFCDRHRSNSSYIYENDGDATKEDTINAIKNYDDAITQLLIYKLSGLTR